MRTAAASTRNRATRVPARAAETTQAQARAAEDELFGHYDPETCNVSFWSRSTSLRPIVAEVERIIPLLETQMKSFV
jgi:hypothetical protein